MASAVDICNLALGFLGDSATLSSLTPPEGSAQADHCASFYPVARDSLLSMVPWSFAQKQVALAELVNDREDWAYCYAMPANCLRLHSITTPALADRNLERMPEFVVMQNTSGADAIYCNLPNALANFTFRVTDPGRFSSLFVTTLSWHLAGMLAGPVLKGDVGAAQAQRCAQISAQYLSKAMLSDVNQQHGNPRLPPGIRARF